MNLEEQFSEPHEWWDRYTEREEERYAALSDGKTCLDCGNCVKSEKHPDEGFCTDCMEFVSGDETVAEMGLECFAA